MSAEVGGPPPIELGAAVEARDGRLGTVDEVRVHPQTGELASLVVRRGWTDAQLSVPAALVERVSHPREVRLRVTRAEAEAQAAGVPEAALAAREGGDEVVIPVLEERLVPGTRPVDLGELRVRKRVEEREEQVRQPVTRDAVEVERVPVNLPLEAPAVQRTEGEWLVIPVMEEVLVVTRQLVLKEEVRIRTYQVTEEQEVRETTRHEHVELEDATARGVRAAPRPEGVGG